MTTLAAHLTDDLLSAYLDGELPAREAEATAEHVAACPGCQARLDGLRRVVRTLRRLERAAPPPLLAEQVARRVALVERDRTMVERIESRLNLPSLDSPLVVSFALVLALAVIVYVVAHANARRTADTRFEIASPESVSELIAAVEVSEVAGRELVRHDGLWVEVMALDERWRPIPHPRVGLESAEGRALAARHPWAAELLAGGARGVLFRDGERWVGLYRAAAAEPGESAQPGGGAGPE